MRRFWLILATTAASAQTIPLVADCSSPDAVVAEIRSTDHVDVHFSLGGSALACYKVSAMVKGDKLDGYLLGPAHPDVAAFERDALSRVPAIPAAPASLPADDDLSAADMPRSFVGLAGIGANGRRAALDQLKSPTVVLYFWSANDPKSVREADEMDGIYELYRRQGVALLGVVSGRSAAQVRKVIAEEEVNWPQILDLGGSIAARYPATRNIRYFVLDRAGNVVAALKTPDGVQRELVKLRKQPGGSE